MSCFDDNNDVRICWMIGLIISSLISLAIDWNLDDSLSTYCKYNPKSLRCLKEDYSLSIDIDI